MNVLFNVAVCWHDRMQKTIGPTTDQINWWCPDCGVSRTTHPTAAERASAFTAAIAKATGEPPGEPSRKEPK